jgi:Flp pilus assembly pilin Flp
MLTLFVSTTSNLTQRLSGPRDDRGASLVEYALLMALIALVCFAAMRFLGQRLNTQYSGVASSLA